MNMQYAKESILAYGRVIYTVGHSNHALENFLGLLTTHRIGLLVDTRSQPYSKYTPHFNGDPLAAACKAGGIDYSFLGKELGGRPSGAEFYDSEGRVLYDKLAQSPLFKRGI